jgi:hypothetical protein
MTTKLRAATSSSGTILDPSVGDGVLELWTGNNPASQVLAASFAADGTPTFLKKPLGAGGVAQVQTTAVTAVATGTTVIPWDDTIPQSTEGDQYLTQTITPTNASSTLEIEAVLMISCASSVHTTVALFQDANVNALAAESSIANTNAEQVVYFKYMMTAGTTSATTFKIRCGPDVGATITLNGSASARKFGGVAASRITIKEYLP